MIMSLSFCCIQQNEQGHRLVPQWCLCGLLLSSSSLCVTSIYHRAWIFSLPSLTTQFSRSVLVFSISYNGVAAKLELDGICLWSTFNTVSIAKPNHHSSSLRLIHHLSILSTFRVLPHVRNFYVIFSVTIFKNV
jgi:hypothetical protein